ncbi:hypothetical protein Tco_1337788 [Tanacetum coccineum]
MLIREPLRNQLESLNIKGFGVTQEKKASFASFQHHPADAPGGTAILFVLFVVTLTGRLGVKECFVACAFCESWLFRFPVVLLTIFGVVIPSCADFGRLYYSVARKGFNGVVGGWDLGFDYGGPDNLTFKVCKLVNQLDARVPSSCWSLTQLGFSIGKPNLRLCHVSMDTTQVVVCSVSLDTRFGCLAFVIGSLCSVLVALQLLGGRSCCWGGGGDYLMGQALFYFRSVVGARLGIGDVIPLDHDYDVPVVELNQHDDAPVVDPLNPPPPASESEPDDEIEVENPIEHEDETVPVSVYEGRNVTNNGKVWLRSSMNVKEKAECKKLKKELEEARLSNTFSNTFLRMQNERVERDLYWTKVRADEFYQEMIRRGFVFEERPNEAINVPIKDEKSPSSELRESSRKS